MPKTVTVLHSFREEKRSKMCGGDGSYLGNCISSTYSLLITEKVPADKRLLKIRFQHREVPLKARAQGFFKVS